MVYKACLLLENAKLTAGITRRQHTQNRGVLEKLPSFLVMSLHHSCLHPKPVIIRLKCLALININTNLLVLNLGRETQPPFKINLFSNKKL